MKIRNLLLIFGVILIPVLAMPQSGGTFAMEKSVMTISGGQTTGGTYTLDSTVGQTIGGTVSSSEAFELKSGFWGGGLASLSFSVSGRVTTREGRGVRNAVVRITDMLGSIRSTVTGPLGFYSFDNVVPGQTYFLSVASRRFQFSPISVPVNENVVGINFVAL